MAETRRRVRPENPQQVTENRVAGYLYELLPASKHPAVDKLFPAEDALYRAGVPVKNSARVLCAAVEGLDGIKACARPLLKDRVSARKRDRVDATRFLTESELPLKRAPGAKRSTKIEHVLARAGEVLEVLNTPPPPPRRHIIPPSRQLAAVSTVPREAEKKKGKVKVKEAAAIQAADVPHIVDQLTMEAMELQRKAREEAAAAEKQKQKAERAEKIKETAKKKAEEAAKAETVAKAEKKPAAVKKAKKAKVVAEKKVRKAAAVENTAKKEEAVLEKKAEATEKKAVAKAKKAVKVEKEAVKEEKKADCDCPEEKPAKPAKQAKPKKGKAHPEPKLSQAEQDALAAEAIKKGLGL